MALGSRSVHSASPSVGSAGSPREPYWTAYNTRPLSGVPPMSFARRVPAMVALILAATPWSDAGAQVITNVLLEWRVQLDRCEGSDQRDRAALTLGRLAVQRHFTKRQ
jgi:hypothetical protein